MVERSVTILRPTMGRLRENPGWIRLRGETGRFYHTYTVTAPTRSSRRLKLPTLARNAEIPTREPAFALRRRGSKRYPRRTAPIGARPANRPNLKRYKSADRALPRNTFITMNGNRAGAVAFAIDTSRC